MYNDDDELEYEDIEDEYQEDDDDLDDEEDSLSDRLGSPRSPFSSGGSSPFGSSGGSSPFGSRPSGSSPFSSRGSSNPFGSRLPSKDDADDEGEKDNKPASSSPFGSRPTNPGSPTFRRTGGAPLGARSSDEEDDDEDDDEGSSASKFRRPASGSSPFGNRPTGSSPFPSRTGGAPLGARSSDSDDEDDDEDEQKKDSPPRRASFTGGSSGSSSPFGSRTGGTGRLPGSTGARTGRDSEKDDKPPTHQPFGSRTGSTGRLPGRPGASGGDNDKPADSGSAGKSPFGSRTGSTGRLPGRPGASGGDNDKPADSGSAGKSPFGSRTGSTGRLPGRPGASGGDNDKPASSGSAGKSPFGSRSVGLPGRRPTPTPDKPNGDSKDDKDKKDGDDSGTSSGERLSALRSRFSLGSKKDDGDKDKKDDGDSGGLLAGATGAISGLRGRLPFGGGSDGDEAKSADDRKPESKKDDKKADDDKSSGSSNPLARFGRQKPSSDGELKPADDKKSPSPKFGARGGKSLKPKDKDDKKPTAKKGDVAKEEGIGARVAALTASLPFIGKGGDADKPASKTVRQRSKAPKVSSGEGLSLDRKLDILGVGLVFVSLALLLSGISPNQGQLTEAVNRFFGNLLGWGAWAVPIAMFLVGGWLIVRHFGDEPPTIDIERLIGVGIIYVALLVLFQFIDALSYENIFTYDDLAFRTSMTWQLPAPVGGGWVGGNLYLLMVRYLGEVLSFSVTIFALFVGVMFLLDVSVSEIAIIMIGLWRSFSSARRRANERKKVRRAERLAQRREQLAALTPPEPQIEVFTPQAEQLPAGEAQAAALPSPEADRAIPITMGGRTVTTSMSGGQLPVEANPQPPAANPQALGDSGNRSGLLGGLFGGGKKEDTPPKPQSIPSAEGNSSNNASPLGGLMNRLPFGGSSEEAAPQPPTNVGSGLNDAPLTPATGNTPSAPPMSAGSVPKAMNQNLFAPPQSSPVSTNHQTPTDEADEVLKTERITQAMRAVSTDEVEQVKTEPDADDSGDVDDTQTRMARLNAIRQGQAAHPKQANGDTPPKPENEAMPNPPAAAANSNGITKPENGKSEEAPTFVAGKTDAYGNAPTPPASMTRPDTLKPKPAAVVSASPRPSRKQEWSLPNIDELLNEGSDQDFDRQFLVEQARIIEDTLKSFGAPGRVVEINTGPVITQYGVEPDYLQSRSGKRSRVKVSAIAQLDRDLQLALGAKSIRIEAPVPGKGYVGIEIPNAENALVSLKDVMQAEQFQKVSNKSPLAFALGQSVDGTPIAADLATMPHLLIAGTTGSGKSVCINAVISSLLSNNTPDDLKFIMVDPKRVELTGYNGIPHLVAPVVVELERIVGVLKWVTREMDERYKRFSSAGARNIVDFNKHLAPDDEKMPYIIVIIDELADLMMLAPEETERTITRIAALARATGIHLVIATQRPSVDVVTGLIKANFPARIAFAVAGSVDSRVILDQPGAERLLGRGDMLYLSGDSPAPQRLQGVFVSDDEIENINRYWKAQNFGQSPSPTKKMAPLSLDPASAAPQMSPAVMPGATPQQRANQPELPMQQAFWDSGANGSGDSDSDEPEDELYTEAVELVRRLNKASVSLLQRRLRIGYTRASRLIDLMEERGVVGEQESGSKPREVLSE